MNQITAPVTPLGRLLARLTPLETEDRIDAVIEDIIAHDGDASPGLRGQPYEIQLHGIAAAGPDMDSAVQRWIGAAQAAVGRVEAIAKARAALRDKGTPRGELARAAAILLNHSANADDRTAAQNILAIMAETGRLKTRRAPQTMH